MTGERTGGHRINEQLNAYWDKLRARHAMPRETDIAIDDLKDIWQNCFLVSVKDGAFFLQLSWRPAGRGVWR